MAESIRNAAADRRRINFPVGKRTAVQTIKGYHASKSENYHKSTGLTGGHRDLSMVDRIPEMHIAPAVIVGDWSETFNRAE